MFMEIIGKSEYMFELILAETVLSACFVRKPGFLFRCAGSIILCLGVVIFGVLRAFTMWESISLVIVHFLLTIGMLVFCYEEQFWKLFFVGVAAFLFQSILYSLFIMGIVVWDLENSPAAKGILYGVILAAAIPMLYFFFARRLKDVEGVTVDKRILTVLVLLAGLIDTALKFYMIDQGLGMEAGGVFLVWKGFSMLIGIFMLCVQFGILTRRSLTAQRDQLEELLYQQQRQFEITRENMELLQMKCHDLKHWLGRMKELEGKEFQAEAEEMREVLAIYDSTMHTGNEALDTILTEKKLKCEYHKIHLTCIVDGKELDVLRVAEICSLFGNILDNAIEAVQQVEEESRRTISLVVKRVGTLLSIHEENYYTGERKTRKGEFETTKEDKERHGFGLRSIRMITERYHGDLAVTAENEVFNLNILLPLENK